MEPHGTCSFDRMTDGDIIRSTCDAQINYSINTLNSKHLIPTDLFFVYKQYCAMIKHPIIS